MLVNNKEINYIQLMKDSVNNVFLIRHYDAIKQKYSFLRIGVPLYIQYQTSLLTLRKKECYEEAKGRLDV